MKIDYLRVDQIGFISSMDGPIEEFLESGEMAYIKWYRQTKEGYVREFNGKYIIEICRKVEEPSCPSENMSE